MLLTSGDVIVVVGGDAAGLGGPNCAFETVTHEAARASIKTKMLVTERTGLSAPGLIWYSLGREEKGRRNVARPILRARCAYAWLSH